MSSIVVSSNVVNHVLDTLYGDLEFNNFKSITQKDDIVEVEFSERCPVRVINYINTYSFENSQIAKQFSDELNNMVIGKYKVKNIEFEEELIQEDSKFEYYSEKYEYAV